MKPAPAPPRVRLLVVDRELLESLGSPDAFRLRHGATVSASLLAHAREVTQASLDFMARVRAEPPWLCHLTVCAATETLIGCCGFRGHLIDLGDARAPEIAYHTFPESEGRGYATAMALALVDVARATGAMSGAASGAVGGAAGGASRPTAVIAHTLIERNASTRVLERVGFRLLGEVVDPEDGRVWRWRRELELR